jgi:hypothetical protein
MMDEVVIAGAARTPMGGFQGMFDGVPAATLGGAAIRAALDGAGAGTVDEVVMGCVLPAGQGQAPARQAGFAAGLGDGAGDDAEQDVRIGHEGGDDRLRPDRARPDATRWSPAAWRA